MRTSLLTSIIFAMAGVVAEQKCLVDDSEESDFICHPDDLSQC